ncbi:MAG: DUF4249 family protein [Bacteroidales bacterium]|nr:DUF4249 family protein [Bacteroidales bacterium]
MCKLLLTFMLLLLIASCRDLVYDEFPSFKGVPVVNSLISADNLIVAHVSLASKIDKNPLKGIESASVLLLADNIFVEYLLPLEGGLYMGGSLAEYNKIYTCEVTIPGYQKVTASTFLPSPMSLHSVEHTAIAGKDHEGMTYPSVKITFRNDPTKKYYYEVVIRLLKPDKEIHATPINPNDPVLANEGLPLFLFSNELIKGSNCTMTLNYITGSASRFSQSGELRTTLYPFILELRTVSYEYYSYVRSMHLYNTGRYPEYGLNANIAFPLYSNVLNGYGIFAGFSSVVYDTIFPSY